MYKEILKEQYIEQYKANHQMLFRELNIMLFDVAFLNECVLHNGIRLDTDIVISYLFKNNFEHLILKTYRIIFDEGRDVLTVDIFINQIIKSIDDQEVKEELCKKIANSSWKSDSVKAIKNRLAVSLDEFRTKAIAHKLTQKMEELSVDLTDISKLLDAAIEVFDIISFYPLDFYKFRITKFSFIAERLTVQEKSKQLLDLLLLSSKEIKNIAVQYRELCEKDDVAKIDDMINLYNVERETEDICTKLLSKSNVSSFIKVTLLQLDEFKKELLQYKSVSDSIILDILYELKERLLEKADKDKVVEYKLSIIDTCIDSVLKVL